MFSSQVPEHLCGVGGSQVKAWWSEHLASTHPLLGETSDLDKLSAIRNSFYDKTGYTRIKGISLRSFAIFVWYIGLSVEGRKSCFDTFLGQVVQSTEMYPIVTPEKVLDEKRLSQWERWETLHDSTCEPTERLALWQEWRVSTSPSPSGQDPQEQDREECPVLVAGGTIADETGTPPSAGAGTAAAPTVGDSGSGLAAAATEATKAAATAVAAFAADTGEPATTVSSTPSGCTQSEREKPRPGSSAFTKETNDAVCVHYCQL